MRPDPIRDLRALAAASAGPDWANEWRLKALANLRRSLGRKTGPRLQLRATPGFVFTMLLAGLPLAGGRAAVAALALCLALLVQQLPALLLASSHGPAELRLSAAGPRVHGTQPRPTWVTLVGVAVGSLLSAVLALGFDALSMEFTAGSRLGTLASVAAWILRGWGVAQLAPLLPFPSGAAIFERLPPTARLMFAVASLGLVIAGGLSVATHLGQPSLLVVIAASAAFGVSALRRAAGDLSDLRSGLPQLLREAERAVEHDEPSTAIRLSRAGLAQARSDALRARFWTALCWGAMGAKDPFLTHAALSHVPDEALTVLLVAAYLRVCGRLQEAETLLLEARALGQRSRETTRLLIDVQYGLGKLQDVATLETEDAAWLTPADLAALDAVDLSVG